MRARKIDKEREWGGGGGEGIRPVERQREDRTGETEQVTDIQ